MSELDVSAARDAIATAVAYPRQIHAAAVAAQGVSLGPWRLSVHCNYGTSDANSYGTDMQCDFSTQRATLQSTMSAAEIQAGQFLSNFQFMSTWVDQTLPATAAAFTNASTPVQAAIAASRAGTLTQAGIDAATNALQSLLGLLQQSSTALTGGMSNLASYALQQEGFGAQIQQVLNGLTTSAQNTINAIQSSLGTMPCGSGDAANQLNGFRSQFTVASGQLQSIFSTLQTQTGAAKSALATLIGTVLNFVNAYQGVITQVRQAQAQDVGSMLEGIRLQIAAGQWQTLANDAGNQLNGERQALRSDLTQISTGGVAMSQAAMSSVADIDQVLAGVLGGS